MIKLIMTDIDGTLVPDGTKNLNPEYYDIIEKLIAKGIIFVVASGRHLMGVQSVFQPILDQLWITSQNGNVITHQGNSEIIHTISSQTVQEFWNDIFQYEEVDSLIETADRAFCPHGDCNMYQILTKQYDFNMEVLGDCHSVPDLDFSMICIHHPVNAEAFVKEHHLQERWKEKMNLTTSGQLWVDCTIPGVSKGNALNRICEKLKIDPKDTIAFGDNMNDISMLETAGIGYAVDNARAEVQQAADQVIPGYAKDGVLEVLKRILADLEHE